MKRLVLIAMGFTFLACGSENPDDGGTSPGFAKERSSMNPLCTISTSCNKGGGGWENFPFDPEDRDGDGDKAIEYGGGDCDDRDPFSSSLLEEARTLNNCLDQKDNNCNGLTDGADPECFDSVPTILYHTGYITLHRYPIELWIYGYDFAVDDTVEILKSGVMVSEAPISRLYHYVHTGSDLMAAVVVYDESNPLPIGQTLDLRMRTVFDRLSNSVDLQVVGPARILTVDTKQHCQGDGTESVLAFSQAAAGTYRVEVREGWGGWRLFVPGPGDSLLGRDPVQCLGAFVRLSGEGPGGPEQFTVAEDGGCAEVISWERYRTYYLEQLYPLIWDVTLLPNPVVRGQYLDSACGDNWGKIKFRIYQIE